MKSFAEYYAEQKAYTDVEANRKVAQADATLAADRQAATEKMQTQKAEAYAKGADSVNRAAVTRLVQSRLLAERMASLGLSGSGLAQSVQAGVDRTQQSAVFAAEQRTLAAVDLLRKKLDDYLQSAQRKHDEKVQTIRHDAALKAADAARQLYQSDLRAEAAAQKNRSK